jgi:hypothetical protein
MESNGFTLGEKVFVTSFSILAFAGIIALTILTKSPLGRVFMSFSPTILVIITVIIMFLKSRHQFRIVSWLLPLFWCAVFFMMSASGVSEFAMKTDVGNILAFNFFISFVFVLVLEIMASLREGFTGIFSKVKVKIPSKPEPQMIKESMQSIEDKAKALNQVIGRVYRRSNGATLKMRNLLKIHPEWYNKFSSITAENLMEKAGVALPLLWKITQRLNDLYNEEIEIFGDDCYKLKNIARDPTGKTRVIDVMTANDSDPVALYFKSALEFCKSAIEQVEMLKNE